jgi:hypothetical protein
MKADGAVFKAICCRAQLHRYAASTPWGQFITVICSHSASSYHEVSLCNGTLMFLVRYSGKLSFVKR